MGYIPSSCGWQRITSSGVISDQSKPILICGYGVESSSTAAVPYFNNGGALAGSTVVFRPGPTTASQGSVVSLPLPVMFASGCYVSFDANTTAVTAFYILQSTSS